MSRRVIIFVLAAGAAVFGAIAMSQAASTPGAQPSHAPVVRPAHKSAATLIGHFSALRSAVAASSVPALPAATAEHLTEAGTMVAGYRLEPAQARYLGVGGTQAWVVPGANGICLVIPTPDGSAIATGCGLATEVNRTGILQVQRPSSGPVVYGLVPNGDSVTVTNQDGSHSNVPVASSFFKYSGPAAQSVSIHSAAGTVVQAATLAKSAGE